MTPEGDGPEVSGSGSSAEDRSVSAGKKGHSAGRDVIHNYPPSTESGTPIAVVAIAVVALVGLVLVIVVAIVFWSGKSGEPILVSTPTDAPFPTATYTLMRTEMPTTVATYAPTLMPTHTRAPPNTPTSTSIPTVTSIFTPPSASTPTPTPTETPTPDSRLSDALQLIGVVNRFIRDELKGRRHEILDEDMWCQEGALEEFCEYFEQEGVQRAVSFTYHERPVMGQASCLWLWSKYVEGMEMEEFNGYQVCTVERWAYLPGEPEENVITSVRISMCYLDVVDEQLCIRVCITFPIWYNDNLAANQWDLVTSDDFWPTPVPPVR